MANRSYYNRFVIGKTGENYVEGMTEYGQKRVFKKRDSPKNWGMSCFAKRTAMGVYDDGRNNKTSFWNIGFVSDEYNELHSFPSIEGKNFAYCAKSSPYWFCRTRNWMPYWGKATKQRAELVKEIRAYWAKKWCTQILPEMKKAIMSSTPIPEDVYDEHFANIFEYPYEIKRF